MKLTFGCYPQSSIEVGFSAEPIVWEVIGEDETSYTLASERIIEVLPFNDEVEEKMVPDDGYYYFVKGTKYPANDFSHSSLGDWLKGEFIRKALDADEQRALLSVTLPDRSLALAARTETDFAASKQSKPVMKDRFYLTDKFDYLQDVPCLTGLYLFTVGRNGASANGSANVPCGIVPVIRIKK